ncbi:hypothetical protein CJ030_MR1G005230 [Morella rubra]|uniref:Uncharacterized protein n=1 Tax=Morella rubra TaxID=262757 RepID=A0A6A1WKL9_9ROSI|nr:hypothetical protein CJ030_MR1G005230 [Morella rubra]
MESKKQGCPPSSLTDLFGAKELPPSASTGTFASIFPLPSTVAGKNSLSSGAIGTWQKHSGNQTWDMKQGTQAIGKGGGCYSIPNKDRGSIFQEERMEPCHLSSSLYYGGQDIYSHSPSTQSSGSYTVVSLYHVTIHTHLVA